MITRPQNSESPAYYQKYFALVKEVDLLTALENTMNDSVNFFNSIPAIKENFRYANGKWSIKEVLSHIIDTERIMSYRCLRFSRKDATELPGYDENLYAPNANAGNRNLMDMIDEYIAVRKASISLFSYLTDEMLDFTGSANNLKVSARMMAWMMTGHNIHHCNVIKEKYL